MDWINLLFSYGFIAPLGVILVFGVLVFIHELGHYAAGRYFGLGVDGFSIGFGTALFSRTDRHGTLWAFRLFPLGGFVKFAGDGNAASQPDKSEMEARVDALSALALWKRSIVVAAGPVANFILAFVLLTFNFTTRGVNDTAPFIGHIAPGSAAAQAGFVPGDTILSINGRQTPNLYTATVALETSLGQATEVQVQSYTGGQRRLQLRPTPGLGRQASLDASGLISAVKLRVTSVLPASPASDMGLQVGDRVVRYDGQFLTNWDDFAAAILLAAHPNSAPMDLEIERAGQRLILQGKPRLVTQVGQDGAEIQAGQFGFGLTTENITRRLGLFASMGAAVDEMRANALLIFKLPAQFIAQQRNLNDLGGPIRLAETIGSVTLNAPYLLIFIAALISLQLGILNLLPIPVLDGGHLLLYGAEALWRRPLPAAMVDGLYRIGFAVLIGFMVMVTFNDLRIHLFGI